MFEMTIAAKDGRVIQRIEVSGDHGMRVGRSHDCEVQVSAPTVSRQHAEIRPDGGTEWIIRDLGSTHGCFVHGQKIRELTITPGLEVQMGNVVLKFDNLASRIGQELDAMIQDDDDDQPYQIISGHSDDMPGLDETLI